MKFVRFAKLLGIVVLTVVLMTVLSAIPPVSLLYGLLVRSGLSLVWSGLVAGVAALCGALYLNRSKSK